MPDNKIITIYNKIADKLEDLFEDINRLANPQEIFANGFHMLSDRSYALSIGPSDPTDRDFCAPSRKRQFVIHFVRKITTTENNLDERVLIEQGILDDHRAIDVAFWNDVYLDGEAMDTTITSDGGINFLDGDSLKYLLMEVILEVEYKDNPSV